MNLKFLKYTTLLIAATLLMDRTFSLLIRQIYEGVEVGQSGGKINYLLNHYDSVGVLAVGNSRCAHHIVPKEISDKTYNLSHNGMSLIFHTGIIDQLLRHEKLKIDTLLLHLELYELLTIDEQRSRDIQHLKNYYWQNEWIRNNINNLSKFEPIKFLLSSYQWNGKLISVLANRIKTANSAPPTDGYIPKPPTNRDSINVIWQKEMSSQQKNLESSYSINNSAIEHLRHLSDLCTQKGTVLICFSSPAFGGAIFKGPERESVATFMNSLGITFWDFSNAYNTHKSLQSIWNWKDVTHMNERGALVFSELIRESLSYDLSVSQKGRKY